MSQPWLLPKSIDITAQNLFITQGWYLVRASIPLDAGNLHLWIENNGASTDIVNLGSNELANHSIRLYFYTHGGELKTNSDATIRMLVQYPQWQIRAFTSLRLIRYRDKSEWSQVSTILTASPTELYELQNAHLAQLDPFYYLDSLDPNKHKNQLQLIDAATVSEHKTQQTNHQRYVIFAHDNDITLHPNAAHAVVEFAQQNQYPEVIFSHHFDSEGQAYIKPAFDPIYLHGYDYIGPAVFWRDDIAQALFGEGKPCSAKASYEALLTYSSAPEKVKRLDELVVKSDRAPTQPDASKQWQDESRLQCKYDSESSIAKWHYRYKDLPTVSVIVPTYNGLTVLKPCIDSLLTKTDYPNLEIIVVDNRSDDLDTLAYLTSLQHQDIKVIKYDAPFNYSAINNYAVEQASGEFMCLLNNDAEAIEKEWLSKMVIWAQQSHIGAVGAKLLYSDNRIQHAGVVVGMGNAAGHIHKFCDSHSTDYEYRLLLNQQMTAVTAACLVVEKALYQQVGGLDEKHFAVAYNDIDFCLKLKQIGKQNMICNDAVLYHHESISRGDDMAPERVKAYQKELTAFQRNWKSKGFQDPVFSKLWNRYRERVGKANINGNFNQ